MQPSSPRDPNWNAESLRLTVFPSPTFQLKDEGWWRKLTGSDPESQTARPHRGELVVAGPFEGNALTLNVQPGRIDWILGPDTSKDPSPSDGVYAIGLFDDKIGVFADLVSGWLTECPPTSRIAFGGVLLEVVENRQRGYRRIAEYLHAVKIDPDGSEDFFYQINRPRSSHVVKNMRLNRLSKWSVAAFQAVSIAMMMQQASQPPLTYTQGAQPVSACRLELDLSTEAGRQDVLSHDCLRPALGELISLGAEIAKLGDVS